MAITTIIQRVICLSLIIFFTNSVAANDAPLNQTGVKFYHFMDKLRNKNLAVEVWYPVAEKTPTQPAKGIWKQANMALDAPLDWRMPTAKNEKLPLIVISHGLQGSPPTLAWLAVSLVKQGFIVVAPQHQDSGPDSKPYMEHWNRAIDVSFMLQELQRSDFANHIDFTRIGMAGYSLGTSTGLWLAGGIALSFERSVNPGKQFVPADEFPELGSAVAEDLLKHTDLQAAKKSYREPLIKSVFLIAPGYGWAFPANQLAAISIPVFIVAAENDERLYPETNAYYLSKYVPNSVMKIMPDIGHFIFINEARDLTDKELNAEDKKKIQILANLGKFRYSAEERSKAQQQVADFAAKFFLTTLK